MHPPGSRNRENHLEFCLLHPPPIHPLKIAVSSEYKLDHAIPWLLNFSWIPIASKVNIFLDRLNLSLENHAHISQDTRKRLSVLGVTHQVRERARRADEWQVYKYLGSEHNVFYLVMGPIDTVKASGRLWGQIGFYSL